MEIELYYADQLVPTGELFRAMQAGTINAVHSDDDSMAAPVDISVFGGYFPFATKHILDVPVLFNQYGLADIWREAYKAAGGVVWLSAAGQDPCHFNTKKPLNTLADLQGLRLYTFPTAGRFLAQFGVVPVSIPYEDVQVAVQTGELDGMSWSGITEDYNRRLGRRHGSLHDKQHLRRLIGSCVRQREELERAARASAEALDGLHRCRSHLPQPVVLGGEAKLRAGGDKLKLTTIPAAEWAEVENAAFKFWDEIAAESETRAKVVGIFKEYNEVLKKAGGVYTQG